MQKNFYKKKVCLPTDLKIFGHVTGNKTYFSFNLDTLSNTAESEKTNNLIDDPDLDVTVSLF